jgi:hypothetical protein
VVEKICCKGLVELFPQKGGWVFVRIPIELTEPLKKFANRGIIPIKAKVGKTSWRTSLMPMGDGTHFIALKKEIRKNEEIEVGDLVEISFEALI